MIRAILRLIDRILAPLPGWIFLLSGLTIVGLALLVPTWIEWRELRWRLDLMRTQTERIVEQRDRFAQFNEALASDDPILLERLAYYHLRLKREELTPLTVGSIVPAMNRTRPNAGTRGGPAGGTPDRPLIIPALANRPVAPPVLSIEDMLERPLPTPGIDYPAYTAVKSRLVRITTGPMRLPLVGAGLLAIIAGLYMPTPPPSDVFEEEEAADDQSSEEEAEVTGELDEPVAGAGTPEQPSTQVDVAAEEPAVAVPAGLASEDEADSDSEPPFDPVVMPAKASPQNA